MPQYHPMASFHMGKTTVHAAHMGGVNNCSDREKARTQAAQAMPCPAEDEILLGPKLGFKQHKGKTPKALVPSSRPQEEEEEEANMSSSKKAAVPSGEDSEGIPDLATARMVADDPLRPGE
ncbi:hypothetical protein FB451DRAFT_1189218 [Mycena latifolia]|nr:hypothetical protein FB451DRAFT_1189218 [Mycena latifolia]